MENVSQYDAGGACTVSGFDCGICSLYSRGTYRSSDKRVHVACKDKRSYERAGDCAPCVKKCNGADFPDDLGEFISVLSGSLIIEKFFSIPGVGSLYLNSINALDYDFFMLLSGFYTLVGLLAGIIVDISYGMIDPRIRMGAK